MKTNSDPFDGADSTAHRLRERARLLASKQDEQIFADCDVLSIVRFHLGGQQLGIPARYVVEVSPIADITPLPGTPSSFAGLTNIRGRVLPVYNMLGLLGFEEYGITDSHQVIVVAADDMEIALLADTIGGVGNLLLDTLQTPMLKTGTKVSEFIQGITSGQLVLVNLLLVLRSAEILIDHPAE